MDILKEDMANFVNFTVQASVLSFVHYLENAGYRKIDATAVKVNIVTLHSCRCDYSPWRRRWVDSSKRQQEKKKKALLWPSGMWGGIRVLNITCILLQRILRTSKANKSCLWSPIPCNSSWWREEQPKAEKPKLSDTSQKVENHKRKEAKGRQSGLVCSQCGVTKTSQWRRRKLLRVLGVMLVTCVTWKHKRPRGST